MWTSFHGDDGSAETSGDLSSSIICLKHDMGGPGVCEYTQIYERPEDIAPSLWSLWCRDTWYLRGYVPPLLTILSFAWFSRSKREEWTIGSMEKQICKTLSTDLLIAAASLLKHTSTVLSVVRVTLNPVCTRFPEWGATKQETPINAKNNSYRCLLLQYHSNTFPIVSVSSPVRVAVQWLTAAGHWVFCTAPRIQHLQIQVNYKLIGLRWQTKWLGDIM